MNKNIVIIICFVVVGGILSAFIKNITTANSLPNIFPAFRFLGLYGSFFIVFCKTDCFKIKGYFDVVFLFSICFFLYFLVGLFDAKLAETIYYLRVYMDPVVFALLLSMINAHNITANSEIYINRINIYLSVFSISALILYFILQVNSELISTLIGDELSTAWFISGGVWMRMGLPTVSPNSLGFISACNLTILFLIYLYGKKYKKIFFYTSIVSTLLCLLLCFSRSSWVMSILGLSTGFVMHYKSHHYKLKNTGLILMISFVLMLITLFLIDLYSDGFIRVWVMLTFSGKDPSLNGHFDSFIFAIEHLRDYFFIGYPHGTVGAKAMLFSKVVNNVENTILSIIFDMGIFLGLLFIYAYYRLFNLITIHKAQLIFIPGFMFCIQMLPYSFEYEIVIYFMAIYFLAYQVTQRES